MILVTGASSGLGEQICEELRERGKLVAGIAVHVEGQADYAVDITNEESIQMLAVQIGEVNGIINCAGVNLICPFEHLTLNSARDTMDVNVWGAVRLVQEFLPGLLEANGFVCNIISSAAYIPMTHSLAYNVSKAGAEMMTRQMAHELRELTVFGVSPSKIADTGMSKYIDETVPLLRGWSPEYAREYQLKGLLTGEEIDKDDLADFIADLVSPPRRHLTGCVIPYGA